MPFSKDLVQHRLPRHEQDVSRETAWFFRLNAFQREHTRRQAEFKRLRWPELPDGVSENAKGHSYPDLLPPELDESDIAEKIFFPTIAAEVSAYLKERGIPTSEMSHLRNSLVSCLNLLFPLKMNLSFAAEVLRPMLPSVKAVRDIEFAFRGSLNPRDDTMAKWLGEPKRSRRPQNSTAVDAAVWWTDGQCNRLTLVNWTYTECVIDDCPGFESCKARHRNLWVRRCTNIHTAEISRDAEHRCYMSSNETSTVSRRYWERMPEAGLRLDRIGYSAQGCVFRGPLHYLMRQWLMADFMSKHPLHDETRVDVCMVHFGENRPLFVIPTWMHGLGKSLPMAWRSLVSHPEDYRTCSVENLMQAHDSAGEGMTAPWRRYIRDRYGV